jgi:hypothetical protein
MGLEKGLGEMETLFETDTCPYCESNKSVYKDTARQELSNGKFSEQAVEMGVGEISVQPVMDPTKKVLTAPQVIRVDDYCLGCGRKYTTKIMRVRVQVAARAEQSPRAYPPGSRGGSLPGMDFPPLRG